MSEQDVAKLIDECCSGDDAARARFYSEYHPFVRRAVLRRLSDFLPAGASVHDADDIAHEIMSRLFENNCERLRTLNQPRSLKAWLVAVSRNEVATFMRRSVSADRLKQRFAKETPPPYRSSPDDSMGREEERDRVRRSLRSLAAEERLILELYYVQGLKYTEIAELLGMKVNTVASKLRRGKEKLRVVLSEDSS